MLESNLKQNTHQQKITPKIYKSKTNIVEIDLRACNKCYCGSPLSNILELFKTESDINASRFDSKFQKHPKPSLESIRNREKNTKLIENVENNDGVVEGGGGLCYVNSTKR